MQRGFGGDEDSGWGPSSRGGRTDSLGRQLEPGLMGAACSRAISGAGQFSLASVEIAKGSEMNLGGCAEVPGLRGVPPSAPASAPPPPRPSGGSALKLRGAGRHSGCPLLFLHFGGALRMQEAVTRVIRMANCRNQRSIPKSPLFLGRGVCAVSPQSFRPGPPERKQSWRCLQLLLVRPPCMKRRMLLTRWEGSCFSLPQPRSLGVTIASRVKK